MERRKILTAAAGAMGAGLLTGKGQAEDTCETCSSECGDCSSACLACVTACLEEMQADGKDRQKCIQLCLDCADICVAFSLSLIHI